MQNTVPGPPIRIVLVEDDVNFQRALVEAMRAEN
jgi:hypothetical protein